MENKPVWRFAKQRRVVPIVTEFSTNLEGKEGRSEERRWKSAKEKYSNKAKVWKSV